MDPHLLPRADRELWRGFLTWSGDVTAAVGRDLATHSRLSVQDMEILGRLWERDGRLDQQELQSWLRWSASRLSHQLTRMSERGLLRRETAGSGRRMVVSLTPAGLEQTTAAIPHLADAVRRHFLADLSEAQKALLRALVAPE
ncbi:MarR family winged helix-turn-helix transcriptional regulator [Nocardioides sp. Iso805N]|uniref:MarR family winged helix-turn-helix transcriptional regulator n=1 Tax=Nocardioides sp. Iso805N TaxID=1283287 RepID=UPI000361E2D4|nr:MarR family winged helix-turn-helix transcriptional regulator [Nocardioides sp. Iso805N]